jgi:hypothetical protein
MVQFCSSGGDFSSEYSKSQLLEREYQSIKMITPSGNRNSLIRNAGIGRINNENKCVAS